MRGWASILMVISFILVSCSRQKTTVEPAVALKVKDFNSLLAEGIRSLDQRDYDTATVNLERAVRLNPDSARAHNFLGMAYLMKKRFQPAKNQFEQAVRIKPDFAVAYSNLATVFWKEKETTRAENTFRKAIEMAPEELSLQYNLGNLLLSTGRTEEGFALLKNVIHKDPGFLGKNQSLNIELSESGTPNPEFFFAYAKLFASLNDVQKTVEFLGKAKKEGFTDWNRILREAEFETLRSDPAVQKFLKDD